MTETRAKAARPNPLLDALIEAFPVFRDGLPLALGIHKQIIERMPEVDVPALRKTLHAYTSSTRYLKATVKAEQRFDLDGQPAGELTQEHRDVAATTLKDRAKRAADKRREAERAQREAEREAKAKEVMQSKISDLANKFKRQ
ncbi:ProQ/FinO family protein [Burkholderiaceae bacterium DAT-1]|nr:ProQ/FinO family protein [Burkholderiaceae bacterium DAT-1]